MPEADNNRVAVTEAADADRTPENTPIPGGGSWRWDYTNREWVENVPPQAIHEE